LYCFSWEKLFPFLSTFDFGGGKNVGKDKLCEMIESFGGVYKPDLSKTKTSFLIEGKEKGDVKSQNAHDWKIPKMSLHDLRIYIEDECRRIN